MNLSNDPSATHPFVCDQCNKSFSKELGLRTHKALVHYAKSPKGKPVNKGSKPATIVPTPAKDVRLPVSYCPCCGTNIAVVAQAMKIAEGAGRA